jgi:plastocyanin
MTPRLSIMLVLLAFAVATPAHSLQEVITVTGTVSVAATRSGHAAEAGNVVVWLKPLRDGGAAREPTGSRPRIVQQNKRFEPHLLVVPVGASVDFPNRDPFFHNVFSMYDGKRFDLGLYESGTSRSVTFTKPGVSFIFCNIHPEMSAVVMAVDTPYHAVSDRDGHVTIPDVPAGRYRLFVWHERHQPARAADFPREIAIAAANPSIGVIQLVESDQVITPHTNKYGQEYNPPRPSSPIYKPGR